MASNDHSGPPPPRLLIHPNRSLSLNIGTTAKPSSPPLPALGRPRPPLCSPIGGRPLSSIRPSITAAPELISVPYLSHGRSDHRRASNYGTFKHSSTVSQLAFDLATSISLCISFESRLSLASRLHSLGYTLLSLGYHVSRESTP